MNRLLPILIGAVLLLLPSLLVVRWSKQAQARLVEAEAVADAQPKVAVAAQANEQYCTPQLKQILRRVLQSCGLIGNSAGRGCEPVDARNVATMSGDDFNALFVPMKGRGAIIQYDTGSHELDPGDLAVVDKVFADRRGASYFFVVSRASPEGSVDFNRELSKQRAEAVLEHLGSTFHDPDLEKQVGLLWLGEEYAQLDPSFCEWTRSGSQDSCSLQDLNRSAFVTWIDCTL